MDPTFRNRNPTMARDGQSKAATRRMHQGRRSESLTTDMGRTRRQDIRETQEVHSHGTSTQTSQPEETILLEDRLVRKRNGSSATTSRHDRRGGRVNEEGNGRRKMRFRQNNVQATPQTNSLHLKDLQRKGTRLPLLRGRSSNRQMGNEEIQAMAHR